MNIKVEYDPESFENVYTLRIPINDMIAAEYEEHERKAMLLIMGDERGLVSNKLYALHLLALGVERGMALRKEAELAE